MITGSSARIAWFETFGASTERDRPAPGRKHGEPPQSVEIGAERFARAQRDVVLIFADVERGHILPADHRVQGLCDVLRDSFATKEFRKVLQPVMGMETFNAGPRKAADQYLRP